MKKYLKIILIVMLTISFAGNVIMYKLIKFPTVWNLSFQNANSWDNYFTVHDIKEAQKISKGKGVKIGILDHYFGCKEHSNLYAGNYDFLNNSKNHNLISEHGYWMTCTLKEIAPEVQVYALSVIDDSENEKINAMVKAMKYMNKNYS